MQINAPPKEINEELENVYQNEMVPFLNHLGIAVQGAKMQFWKWSSLPSITATANKPVCQSLHIHSIDTDLSFSE